MTWRIELSHLAEKQLNKLDKQVSKRIINVLYDRIAVLDNPRNIGEALNGQLAEFWKYRVGDYRIICKIEDAKIQILVVKIGNRREVYKD